MYFPLFLRKKFFIGLYIKKICQGNSIIPKVILYVKYLVTRGSNPIPGKNFILFGILYCIY